MTPIPAVMPNADTISTNWSRSVSPDVLYDIHQPDVNIAIYDRQVDHLIDSISELLDQQIQLRAKGDIDTIMTQIRSSIGYNDASDIVDDIHDLLKQFQKVSASEKLKVLLAAVNTNMCRKFHTDINDIRLLCTYHGPGTLWLSDDNINHQAMDRNNESIAMDESKVKQVQTGSVALLKGAIYPQSKNKAVVHRSPTIEESDERRLLLRIDTCQTENLWT